jgi:hypothetical protein
MSSTNRGYERHKTDYYVTPQEPIRVFLSEFLMDVGKNKFIDDKLDIYARPDRIKWFDPCAGGDNEFEMSYPAVINKEFGVEVDTLDIREDSCAKNKGDYLITKLDYRPDVIITNPPFFIARQVIEKALEDVIDGGYIIMLLRLNFFGSKERFTFFKKQMPILAYVHQRRFSFTKDKKTDSIEYMHAIWQKGSHPAFTMLKII